MANGTLKVSNIQTSSGSGTITIGQSGETIDLSNGTATLNSAMKNTPAFLANLSSTQSLSNNTDTTIIFDNEIFDTDNAYDTSTGIFTVPSGEAGKYFICADITLTATQSAAIYRSRITKNGTSTTVARGDIRPGDSISFSSGFAENTPPCSAIVDLAVGDTLRCFSRIESGNGTLRVSASSSGCASQFFGYKLIGA